MTITSFHEAEILKLGYYVYRLIDPRSGQTFYVGKGHGNRVFEHAVHVEAGPRDDDTSAKIGLIKEIKTSGLEVHYVIHRHGMDEVTAFAVESALIDAYPGLANIQGGHGGGEYGIMHPLEIRRKYGLPEFPCSSDEPVILINLNQLPLTTEKEVVKNQLQFAWRINDVRANRANWVIGVIRGVSVCVYESSGWRAATKENFPTLQFEEPKRSGFDVLEAPKIVWDKYVGEMGKRITAKHFKHNQNPVLYYEP